VEVKIIADLENQRSESKYKINRGVGLGIPDVGFQMKD
jgi:hypothetical protein